MDKTFLPGRLSPLEARYEAQKIAFAPVIFQATRLLRDFGILKAIDDAGDGGLSVEAVASATDVSPYGVTVLLETGLSAGVVDLKEDRYLLTKVGNYILYDEMTRVNLDFNHDVCYEGMFYLDEAIREGKPAGLKVFGSWDTVYEALASLPEKVQKSWFAFDHFYSDSAFPDALPQVFKYKPARLMDIGGNTGKWTLQCLNYDEDVQVTILDLPGQLAKAQTNIDNNGFGGRFTGCAINLLDPAQSFPKGHQAIWMSQFLCCFSEEEIIGILTRAAAALDGESRVFILDTYWDRQDYDIASYCLINSSPYFTAIANGNSRMYHSKTMQSCIRQAGLVLEDDIDNLGLSHTLMICKKG